MLSSFFRLDSRGWGPPIDRLFAFSPNFVSLVFLNNNDNDDDDINYSSTCMVEQHLMTKYCIWEKDR